MQLLTDQPMLTLSTVTGPKEGATMRIVEDLAFSRRKIYRRISKGMSPLIALAENARMR